MDDDGMPAPNCLQVLLSEITKSELNAVAPLVIDHNDHSRLSFGLFVDGEYVDSVDCVCKSDCIYDQANMFNGVLLHRSIVSGVGLPNEKFFIEGDETDYLHRIRRAGFSIATFTSAKFYHPAGEYCRFSFMSRNYVIWYTGSHFKSYFLYRNAAYIHREYAGMLGLLRLTWRYMLFFLVFRSLDIKGLLFWLKATADGVVGNFNTGKHYIPS